MDELKPRPAISAEAIENSIWNKVINELNRIPGEHRLVVIITHGVVDMMVNAMIEKVCRHQKQIVSDHRQWPHASRLLLLNEMEVLTDEHYRMLKWLNSIRNEFAHKPLFEMTPSRLELFASPEHRDLANFVRLNIAILMEIWISYGPMIGDLFFKELEAGPRYVKGPTSKPNLVPLNPSGT